MFVLSFEQQDSLERMQMPHIVLLLLHHYSFVFAKFGRNEITFHVRITRAQLMQVDFKND